MKKVPIIEEYRDKISFTDGYGATLIIEFIDVNDKKWVRVLLDNEKQEVRDYLEKHDEGVHIPFNLFELLWKKMEFRANNRSLGGGKNGS